MSEEPASEFSTSRHPSPYVDPAAKFSTDRDPSPSIPRFSPKPASPRRPYIDWLRGFAVLIMIEWHVVDAWTTTESRVGPVYTTLALVGGFAAPLFLFLAGVAIPFAAGSHQRKSGLAAGSLESVRAASWALQKRGWQVVLIAHLFRFHSFIWNLWGRWDSVFKPDILNILGLGMVATAWCWGRSPVPFRRMAWLLVPAGITLLLSPEARAWSWPTLLHVRLEAYIRPNGWGQFAVFPWVAFVFAGAAIGEWIAQPRPAEDERRFHGRLALAGAALIIAGVVAYFVPSPFLPSEFWTTSTSFFLIRTGVMTLLLSGAWLRMSRARASGWSPIVLFGQTSLFVYWLHVELAYGLFSAAWKRSLTIPEAAIAYSLFTVLMLVAARWWMARTTRPWIPEHLRA
ncbi:MAG TPA: heparan-alpha-glucosaminide N-acetyltransferase domain-containing protein [Vicinamibacterales bacterium]|nr:heparan-alpha-glucosaminide N-acetyltransferase domain-containing protein [Vicinamibacterales bacterium]